MRLSSVTWQANAVQYAAEFSAVLCQGDPLPPDQLVAIFLANVSDDVPLRVTKEGHIKFTVWEEAVAELEKIVGTRGET
mgnify:CR=1 FL=1